MKNSTPRHAFGAFAIVGAIAVSAMTSTSHTAFAQSQVQAQALTPEVAAQLTKAWAEAISTGRLNDWMAMHATDIEFANHSWFKGRSREEMRRWGQAVIDAGGVYRIVEHRIENGILIWTIDYKDRTFAINERGTITVVDGQIKKLILGPLP
jgi:uncharacterized protein YbaA (DUF1428 family)